MLKIISNKIRCKFCGETIQSHHLHQFVQCRCGKCFTDGGLDYIRRGFDGEKAEDVYEDLSLYADENGKVYTAEEAKGMDIFTVDGLPSEEPTASSTPDIPEVTEERSDEPATPKKKPKSGRYNFETGETIKEND